MRVLNVENLSKGYSYRNFSWVHKKTHMVVREVDLYIKKGSCLGLVGESGCGKTTLGKIIAGIEKPDSGRVLFQGRETFSEKCCDTSVVKNKMQMVFQDCVGSVNPRHTAGQIIMEPAINAKKYSGKDNIDAAIGLLQRVGLQADDINKYPSQFSGGQLQRISIARALSSEPELVILDEPLSSLDVSVQAQILNLLADLKSEFRLSYLFISHDIEAVYYLSDALAVMYLGSIVEYIDNIKSFDALCHPYTKRLLSSVLTADPARKNMNRKPFNELSFADADGAGCPYAGRCSAALNICRKEIPVLKRYGPGHRIACHMFE